MILENQLLGESLTVLRARIVADDWLVVLYNVPTVSHAKNYLLGITVWCTIY